MCYSSVCECAIQYNWETGPLGRLFQEMGGIGEGLFSGLISGCERFSWQNVM